MSGMRVGVIRLELRLPGARSLKEKRRPLRSLIEQIRNRFHCAVAEVDHQDTWQRAAVGIAVVAADEKGLRTVLEGMRRLLAHHPEWTVLDLQYTIYPGPAPFGFPEGSGFEAAEEADGAEPGDAAGLPD
jgi:hypothetical protein